MTEHRGQARDQRATAAASERAAKSMEAMRAEEAVALLKREFNDDEPKTASQLAYPAAWS